jgi:hypothetical protein
MDKFIFPPIFVPGPPALNSSECVQICTAKTIALQSEMDLLGGYGSSDDDDIPVVAGPLPPPAEDAVQSSASKPIGVISVPSRPSVVASLPTATPPAPLPAPSVAPKRKLPSAADLLSGIPITHTYAGFNASGGSENAGPVDEAGTRYNTVAMPKSLHVDDEDVATWRRPPQRTTGSGTISFAARSAQAAGNHTTASVNSKVESTSSRDTQSEPKPISKAAIAFAPPQLRRSNIVTEDTAAWNTQRKKSKPSATQ